MDEKIRVIDEGLIERQLEAGKKNSKEKILDILAKARGAKGLEPVEAAALYGTGPVADGRPWK